MPNSQTAKRCINTPFYSYFYPYPFSSPSFLHQKTSGRYEFNIYQYDFFADFCEKKCFICLFLNLVYSFY